MKAKAKTQVPADIDSYIASFAPDVQTVLKKVRATIRKAAPGATEAFKYRIPTYELNGHLVFFSATKKHVGVYPRTAGVDTLPGVAERASGRGTVRLPFDQPIPYDLIARIVKVRVAENLKTPAWGAKQAVKAAEKKPAKKKAAKKKPTRERAPRGRTLPVRRVAPM